MPLIIGIVIFIFGAALLLVAIKRRIERKRVAGLAEFTCSDRMVNTKKIETAVRYVALILLLSGFVIIAYEALRLETSPSDQVESAINRL